MSLKDFLNLNKRNKLNQEVYKMLKCECVILTIQLHLVFVKIFKKLIQHIIYIWFVTLLTVSIFLVNLITLLKYLFLLLVFYYHFIDC